MLPQEKNLGHVPLRCHFLQFEISVNGNTAPKIIAGSWSDAKMAKMDEEQQKNTKKHAKTAG